MRYRSLGARGLRVSELFLGAMTFAGGFAHGAGRAEAQRIVDAYAESAATSSAPRSTTSEQLVGEILAGRRDVPCVDGEVRLSADQGPREVFPRDTAGRARVPAARRR